MSTPVYDRTTKSYITLKTAVKRGFPSDNFTLRGGYKAYAIKDGRTNRGYRWDITNSAFEVKRLNASKKARSLESMRKQSHDFPIVYNGGVWVQPYTVLSDLNVVPERTPLDIQILDAGGKVIKSVHVRNNAVTTTVDLYKTIFLFQFNDSDTLLSEWANALAAGTTLRIVVYRTPTTSSIQQSFAAGDTHCILAPVLKTFMDQLETQKDPKSKRSANIKGQIKRCQQLIQQFKDGIPEDKMEMVAKSLDSTFQIEDVMENILAKYNPRAKGRIYRFVNTRINHCEYFVNLDSEAEEVSLEKAREIIQMSIANNIPTPYTGTIENPRLIRTPGHTYVVGTPIKSALVDFNKSFDRGMNIDSIKEPDLAKFCIEASHLVINWTPGSSTPANEIDMKQAYTQYKRYSGYMGFPAIINNVRVVTKNHNVIAHPGIYQVRIKSFPDNNAGKILRSMGFGRNNYTLTSPWIIALRNLGCNVVVEAGAWGKRMDFDFSEEMKDQKAYAIWTGMQMCTDEDSNWRFPCTPEFASVMMAQGANPDMYYSEMTKTLIIRKKKESHYILPHIAAFIVSYCQLNVLTELLKYDVDEIVGSKLDSIMVSGDLKPYDKDMWVNVKDDPAFTHIKMCDYPSKTIFKVNKSTLSFDAPITIESFLQSKQLPAGDMFISGQGGCGKTYIVCEKFRKGFRKPVFTSIAWKLIAEVVNKYKIRGTSTNQLVGRGYGKTEILSHKFRFGQPGVIIGDELSMWSAELVKTIQDMYPYSQLILLGDYHDGKYYQTSMSNVPELYHPANYHRMTSDFRSKDEETKVFKLKCRDFMDNKDHFGLLNYLYESFYRISPEELKAEYDMDYVLTGTHRRCDYFTKLLKLEDKNHYLVMDHNFSQVLQKMRDPSSVYLHGEIVDEPVPQSKIRHGFTVHSFQGSEVVDKRCYIDILSLHTLQDIYTALSRVHRMSQIKLVWLTSEELPPESHVEESSPQESPCEYQE